MQKLIKQLFTNFFFISVKFCLVLDALPVSVNMPYRMGQKLSSRLLLISAPNIDGFYRFYQCYAQRTINEDLWQISPHLKRVAGYTTLKSNCFQKLCRRSTVTSVYPTRTYWRECKHSLKLKRKLNFFGPSCTTVSSYNVYKHRKCI